MKRIEPNSVPGDLRGLVSDLNIQNARAMELLELMKSLPAGDERLFRLMDLHDSSLTSYFELTDRLACGLEKRLG